MKINIKYAALSLLAVAGITMTSCSDDESYDVYGNPNNLVYFQANADNTFTGTVAHTPVGDFGGVDAKFPVRILRAASCDTKVTAMVDASLVEVYNAEHHTEYKAMPESAVNLGGMTVTIKKGAVKADDSIKVSLKDEALASLTEKAYLLPIRLSQIQGDGKGSEERGFGYIIVNTETKLIKDIESKDDVTGTLLTDYTGWTAKYSPGSDIDVAQLFDGNLENGAALRADGDGGRTKVIVFDMGATKNVSGFRFARYYKDYYGWWQDAYYFSSVKIEFSTDGSTWNEAGTATESAMPKSEGYQYCSFYGGVSARYLRFSFESGESTVSSLAELGVYVAN